jgi:DNA-binding CsgD family transcriptional regulator
MALLERLAPSDAERADIEWTSKSVLGQVALASGRHVEAHECITAAIEAARRLGTATRHAVAELLAADVGCLVALGALEEASRQLERVVEIADELAVPTLHGLTARAQGVVAAAEGDSGAALNHLERAVELFEALPAPWPFEHARTLFMLGGVQRRARQKLAARRTLERALEMFERLGARLWAEKTRAELSQISGRPSRPGALTATEQSVAHLVASGHSNVEVAHELFLSPKTVEWNLSKIYKKLHVRSRTELAAKLSKQAASR